MRAFGPGDGTPEEGGDLPELVITHTRPLPRPTYDLPGLGWLGSMLPDVDRALGDAFFGSQLYGSYNNMMSTQAGRDFYFNLHKYDKKEAEFYGGLLASIIVPEIALEVIAELGSVALTGETVALLKGSQEAVTTVVEAEEAAVAIEQGSHVVYQGVDAAGTVKYVGITGRDATVRFAEHVASGTSKSALDLEVIQGATNLTKTQARVWEQNLINQHGLPNLLNKINSITPSKWAQYGVIP